MKLLMTTQGRIHCRHSRESGNPDAVPVKMGNQNTKNLDARLRISGMTNHKHWIPGQARNDIKNNI